MVKSKGPHPILMGEGGGVSDGGASKVMSTSSVAKSEQPGRKTDTDHTPLCVITIELVVVTA